MESRAIRADEVDGAALKAVIRRFRAHHALRIARTGERLISRHRRVLEALPMLYHRNHPALPGYVGPDVPHGIANYRPGPGAVRALRMVARTYVEPRFPTPRADLHAMFLMGSGGTVGQSRGSDVDLWVCCDTLMQSALWPKVRMIDQWAGELGLELHTFLVDPDVLRTRRRLPGSRIPMLVLDEFYRSGALMAGRYPLWWLVADDDPVRYAATAERLMEQRFVPGDDVIDFGPVGEFPADELAHAAITELDRALATPHKSLLKLKLVEAYAETPELGTVSSAYRARIHAGATEPLQLDPYMLLYDHVERHLLATARPEDLSFARTLLIGKSAESVPWHRESDSSPTATGSLLTRFTEWGFDADEVERFRTLSRWTMSQRLTEHRRIMDELHAGVRLVQTLVDKAAARWHQPHAAGVERTAERHSDTSGRRDPGGEDDRQLHWLNETRLRQLRLAVTRMEPAADNGLAVLHPALISRHRVLPLQLLRDGTDWLISDGGAEVLRCRRLVEAVVWAELNGAALAPARSETTLARVLAQVLQGFRGTRQTLYAFVNAECRHQRVLPWHAGAGDEGQSPDTTLLTLHNDPLDYGGFHQLHLETLDLVWRDAAGHWRLQSLLGEADMLDALGRLFASPSGGVSWQVPGGQERFLLAHRLEQLHGLCERILSTSGALFVLPFGADTVTIRRDGDTVETRRHRSLAELQAYVQATGSATVAVDPASQRLRALLRAG